MVDQRRAVMLEIHAIAFGKEIRQPEQEGPPHRIDQEAARHVSPGLAGTRAAGTRRLGVALPADRIRYKPVPAAPSDFISRGRRYQISHTASQTKVRRPVRMKAICQPQRDGDDRHDEGRQDRADIGAGIEDADGQRPLAQGKPFRRGRQGGGKEAGFAQAHGNTHQGKTDDAGHKRMRDVRYGPEW